MKATARKHPNSLITFPIARRPMCRASLDRSTRTIARVLTLLCSNAPKTAGSTREIPMLPWVVDLLKRLPRRLHSDGSEIVFLSPEGKPMTNLGGRSEEPARRPVDDESKSIWLVPSPPWDPAEEVLHDTTHIHRVGAFGGSQLEGPCRVLRNICANDRAEPRRHEKTGTDAAFERMLEGRREPPVARVHPRPWWHALVRWAGISAQRACRSPSRTPHPPCHRFGACQVAMMFACSRARLPACPSSSTMPEAYGTASAKCGRNGCRTTVKV
jgi:hypothetical protein